MITHNITLRVKDQNAVDTGIAVSQGDYGRVKFVIYVKDGETYLSGAETAELAFTTPNGYIVTGNVTIETGAYSYIFQGNELQAAGKVSAVLTLTFSDGRVSTCGFLFVCRYNPMYDRNMDAGPYLGEIETLKSAAQFALEDARGAAAVAEAAKEAAVSAANNAEAVSGVGIATSQKAGLVKPDGSTTSVDAEGILSIILKDTHGILGTENATVMMQALIDAIADKVVNQVLTKAMLINNGLTTESGKYPLDAAYGKTLLDLYTKLNSDYIIPASNNYARIDKYGHVDLSVIATADYAGKLTTIFTIEEKYRPLSEKMIIGKTTINGNVIPCTFYIRSNGNLDAYAGESIDTSVPFVCCGGYSVK